MKITDTIKTELSDLKIHELWILGIAIITIIINSIILKDSLIAAISAICGILYTIFAGKGKVYCFIIGLYGSCCYSLLSLQNQLYGNLLLYLCFYIPAQITGFISWKKNLKEAKLDIIKTNLSKQDRIKTSVISFIGCIATVLVLKYIGDSNPLIDGITTFLSIIGMLLTVKRCIEQWIIWIIVNTLSVFMWLFVVLSGVKVYSTLVMWIVYVILAVYFYFEWNKEIKKAKS